MRYLIKEESFTLSIILENNKSVFELIYFDEKYRGINTLLEINNNLFNLRISSEAYSALYVHDTWINLVLNGHSRSQDKKIQSSTLDPFIFKRFNDLILSKYGKITKLKLV